MRRTVYFLAAALFTMAVSGMVCQAQDSSFTFETTSPRPYSPAYLGNGTISLVTAPLGTEPSRSFLAGVYDHSAGDVPRIAAAPDWNEIDVHNGLHWLNANASFSGIEQYRQTLDMYDGLLRTHYLWVDGDKRIEVHVEQFVSRDRAPLAAVRATLIPQFSGKIGIRLPLRNWPAPHRYALGRIRTLEGEAKANQWAIWYPGHLDISEAHVLHSGDHALLFVLAKAPGTGLRTGEAVALQWPTAAKVEPRENAGSAEVELNMNAIAGQSYTFTKFAALASSAGADEARNTAVLAAGAAVSSGWDALLNSSKQAWHELWESDVIVEGDPNLQRTIHSMLFYLLGSTRKHLSISVGPMGLSSAGYYGHIFWDADIFMFPALAVLHPDLAEPMVAFRSRTLEAARENAKKNGYRGAMYPWEAGPDGVEATPRFAAQNASSENHVNGDVALASWQYWLATGDSNWLRNHCWPILRDTADFWVSRVNYDEQHSRYEISHVVAVNESEIGVSNDPYTNAIAKKNLELAMATADALHQSPHPQWREVAQKMYTPISDSALLWYPLDRIYSEQETRTAVQKMLSAAEQERQGAMMGTEFYPILAAQIGDRPAIGKLLIPLVKPYLRPPFQVVAETPRNQNTNFITGAGAFLQQLVFGYTGLRLESSGLERKFRPILPPGIPRLTLKNITIHGKRETLVFTSITN